MTKEERAENKRLRDIEKEQRKQDFPVAHLNFAPPLDPNWTQVCLLPGDRNWITLRRSIGAKWHKEASAGEKSTIEYISVDLREDIKGLAALIRALALRYNAIVKDANSEALAVPRMEPLAMIDIPDPPETYQHDGTRTD